MISMHMCMVSVFCNGRFCDRWMGRKLATACTLKNLLHKKIIYNAYGDTSTVTIIYYHMLRTYYTHVKLLRAIDERSPCLYATM